MNYRVNATYRSQDGPGDLREHAKKLTSRKVLRFLDAASMAPFVVTAALYRSDPAAEPKDVALYTVGGWDGDMPDQPFRSDGSADSDALISQNILEEANPVNWLRMLSNNALCQVSISEGFRGPNAHLVGGPDALEQVLAVAAADLRRGAAKQALIIAYDTDPEHRNHPSGRAPSAAAGLSLVAADEDDVLPALFDLAELEAATSDSALDVMHSCIASLAATRPALRGTR
ncbi:hypothetical protein ACGFWI_25260 [Streptomyces sp. NPDC048434]|uniref:hypothetical protein n=1 Tax=Streptomyces sp. NPDC048434 TaxID=3365549 RepID=UPI00371A7C3A